MPRLIPLITPGTAVAAGGPAHRTLLIKNTAVTTNCADLVPLHYAPPGPYTPLLLVGMLRDAITADLVVKANVILLDGVTLQQIGTLTIPAATPVGVSVVTTSFVTTSLPDLSGLRWDILASDGSQDLLGVASVTLWYQ